MSRLPASIAVSVVLLTAVTSCAGPPARESASDPAAQPVGPKRIAVAIRGDPLTISSKINAAGAGSVPGVGEVERMINGGLTMTDHEDNLRPQLANEVPTVENGLWKVLPDGRMEMTWNLREGVKWHDGASFTSADVLFTTRVEQDPELAVLRNRAYRSVESVEAPDAHTVQVRWKEPFIEADTMFNSFGLPMPRHLLEDAYLNQKATFLELKFWSSEYVGTGAYRLKDWMPGVHAVLVRNPDYILGTPKIDEVEVKFIPDPNTLAANILAGEIDLTLGGRLALEWGIQVRDQWSNGRMVTNPPTSRIGAFPQLLTPDPAVIGNVEFRRALLHAVDRDQISDSLVQGLAPPAHSLINPRDRDYPAFERSIVRYDYDPARAERLITGLGYTKGPDRMFQGPNGPLRIEVRTRANDEMQVKSLLAAADFWERAGVGIDQVHVPQQLSSNREYRSTHPGFEIVRQPGGVGAFDRYHGKDTPLPENRFSGSNRIRYQNPEFDRLIDSFLTTIPVQERMSYGAQIVRHMTEQALVLELFWDPIPVMVSNRLTNVAGPGEVWDTHQWDVKTS